MKLMVTDMGESNKHKVLVEYALRFIKDSVGEELSYFIETDINDGRPLPQLTMEGYRPDVFFEYNGVMFIGEAKTSDDILREHSINQYYSSKIILMHDIRRLMHSMPTIPDFDWNCLGRCAVDFIMVQLSEM